MNNFENICFDITSDISSLSLEEKVTKLNELKKHIKKDFININMIPEYFNLIFTILNQKSLKYEPFINNAYSILCYLIKRIYIQDKSKLVYNSKSEYLNDCLIWLSIKCDTDNNSKKALFCLYSVQQTNTFVNMLCKNADKFINIENLLRFLFENIIQNHEGKDREKLSHQFEPFFNVLDSKSKSTVNNWKVQLDIFSLPKTKDLLSDFLNSMKSAELENHTIDDKVLKERQYSNTPTLNRYMKNTFPKDLFEGKETEMNWKLRLNYLTSLIVNIQKFKNEFIISEDILMNVLKCSTSLRTSLTLHALKFMSLVFDSDNVTINETILIRILMQMYQLIQTNKKILFNAENEVFCKGIRFYIKSRYNCMKLYKIINTLCCEKNILCVACAVDYLTLIYLCIDKYIQNSGSNTKRDCLYYEKLTQEDVDNYQILMNDIKLDKINVPLGVYLFKKLLSNSSGQVKAKLRRNFWEHMDEDLRNFYLLKYLDRFDLKKISIGYEHELINIDKTSNFADVHKTPAVVNKDDSIIKYDNQLPTSQHSDFMGSKTKRNDENDVYIDDLELLDVDIMPQYEMTMIPFKKRKIIFEEENEVPDTRVSSGETYVNTKSHDVDFKLDCTGVNNINSDGFDKFHRECTDFLQGKGLNITQEQLDNRWCYFLENSDIKLQFKILILLSLDNKHNEFMEQFIRRTFQTIENKASKQMDTLSDLLLMDKLCKKRGLNSLDYLSDQRLYKILDM